MCGIAAIVSNGPMIPRGAIEAMVDRLRHRGPDAEMCVKLASCHLGHSRLSVIDVAGGRQPMGEEEGRYWIVLNGEIYNYRGLRAELEKRGWGFRTQSDTEVLLRGYQEYGEGVLAHLYGQFAFVIWDERERLLFAGRDRLGEKPIYWASSDRGYFLLGSEIKGLLASGLIEPRIDRVSVDAYLALLYVPPDRTIYENVHTLRPGHALCWREGQWRQWSYWTPSYSQQAVADELEAVEQLRVLISEAVGRTMVADVPVGAFLSGGLDSSTVVALMTQHSNRSVMTFSVGFGNLINELPYARSVAERYHTDHYEIQMNIDVGEMLERMAEVYDEPFADSSNIPTYLIAAFARRHVKVVLSGDGGDELFGGYEWYSWLLSKNSAISGSMMITLQRLAALGWGMLTRAGLPFRAQRDAVSQAYRVARVKRAYVDPWECHLALATGLKADRSRLWNGHPPVATAAAIERVYRPGQNAEGMDRAIDFDVRCYLPGDILVKVDRAAMAHGLESRAPFLDVDLVEFVLGLSWRLRFRDGKLKYLLRHACSDLWPDVVQRRSKQGFGAPIWHWTQRPDVQSLLQRVCGPGTPLTALLPGIRGALPALSDQQVWTVLSLGLWLEKRSECLSNLP